MLTVKTDGMIWNESLLRMGNELQLKTTHISPDRLICHIWNRTITILRMLSPPDASCTNWPTFCYFPEN